MLPDSFIPPVPQQLASGGQEDGLMPEHVQLNVLELCGVCRRLWLSRGGGVPLPPVGEAGMLLSAPTEPRGAPRECASPSVCGAEGRGLPEASGSTSQGVRPLGLRAEPLRCPPGWGALHAQLHGMRIQSCTSLAFPPSKRRQRRQGTVRDLEKGTLAWLHPIDLLSMQ